MSRSRNEVAVSGLGEQPRHDHEASFQACQHAYHSLGSIYTVRRLLSTAKDSHCNDSVRGPLQAVVIGRSVLVNGAFGSLQTSSSNTRHMKIALASGCLPAYSEIIEMLPGSAEGLLQNLNIVPGGSIEPQGRCACLHS